MRGALYLTDAYRKEFDSTVTVSFADGIVLEETVFYPAGGGQPSDQGEIVSELGDRWKVISVEKSGNEILHKVEGVPPTVGTKVHGTLDWNLRYAHMRYHTCLHLLSGVVFHKYGSAITGNQIYADRARMDLTLNEFTPTFAQDIIREVNEVAGRHLPVSVRFLNREEADRDPALVRVARNLMPDVKEVRLIDIEGFDVQADGGTHVANTREVGKIQLLKTENKGARNKRLYVTLT